MDYLFFILFAGILIMIIIDLIKNKFSLVAMMMEKDPKTGELKPSSGRFWQMIFGFMSVWMTVYYVLNPEQFKIELYMISIIATFAPKLVSKFAESWAQRAFKNDKP